MIDEFGEKHIYRLRRLVCRVCGDGKEHIHTEIPDFITPYKRHCAATVERAVNGDFEAICEDNPGFNESTAKRIHAWGQILMPYFTNLCAGLSRKVGAACDGDGDDCGNGGESGFRAVVHAVVNCHAWTFERDVLAAAPGVVAAKAANNAGGDHTRNGVYNADDYAVRGRSP